MRIYDSKPIAQRWKRKKCLPIDIIFPYRFTEPLVGREIPIYFWV